MGGMFDQGFGHNNHSSRGCGSLLLSAILYLWPVLGVPLEISQLFLSRGRMTYSIKRRMQKLASFSLAVLLYFATAGHVYGDEWTLARDKNEIRVYTKPVAGSELNAVRGVTTVESSLGKLVTLLRDPSLRSRWDSFCGDSYLFKQVSAEEELVYLHSKMPWPVSDRDMVNRVTWQQDPESLVVTMHSVATRDLLGPVRGRVRVTEAVNDWQLTPLAGGLVEISTTVHLDPAGPLPSWLINSLSIESPYDVLKQLKALVSDEKIKNQQPEFIQERDGERL